MRRMAFALPITLAILPLLHAAEKKPVTVEVAASAPAAGPGFGPIVWAPDGKRFVWAEKRVLWIYDIPSAQRKQVADLAKLDAQAVKYDPPEAFKWQNRGVSEANIQWAASGERILIRAGGDLFFLNTGTGTAEQLTATDFPEGDPKLSPDGRRVSFRRDHDLYTLEIASKKITRLTRDGSPTLLNGELDWVYPEELQLGTAHWWSPDSTRVAYLQFDIGHEWTYPHADLLPIPARFEPQRYPKAGSPNADVRLGVVAASGGETRWMDLGDTRDALLARVAWSPDSRALFAQRLNRIQNRLDLLNADAQSGIARQVLREQDRYWVNLDDVFRFIGDGSRFLWGSERDGFRHLYLYGADGRLIRQLTRGEWEVDGIAGVDAEAREVYFTASEAGPLERQFYRVGLDGKRRQRLTKTPGTHAISMSSTCEYFMDTASSLTAPPRRTLHAQDGAEAGVWQESPAQEYEILPTEIVNVKAADGTLLYGRLIRPKGFEPGKKYPVVTIVYGGPHAQNVRDAWAGATWEQALAQRGFVVWQLDNRGTAGRGHAFEAKVFRNLGAVELEDQQAGIRHLVGMGVADPARLGIYGWSYGGFMTLYTLANAPELFRAGIAGAPVADWRNYDTIYTERYMGLPSENPDGYRRSAPVHKAADITARVMLVHNLEDDNVHFQNTMQVADALQRANKRFEMMIYNQKTHGVAGTHRRHMLESMTEFFERHLK
ncbi:MAG TPA: S9 family peptidase [Bryobacteraceae bacterium]|nr:S9 family peptidase [Bryobacteraceae bacterium]